MKVLPDEDLPHTLRHHLPLHEVFTVRFIGWNGLRNGKLIQAAEDAGYAVLVTGDKGMPLQQNIEGRQIALVVLSSQEWPILKPFVDKIASAVNSALPGSVQRVECGEFRR